MENDDLKPGDYAVIKIGWYNPVLFSKYGIDEDSMMPVSAVTCTPGKFEHPCHPKMVTVSLPNGEEHAFSAALFQRAPQSREC